MSERYNTILTFDITIVVRSLGTILYWNMTSCYGEDTLHFDINSVIILIIRGSMTGGGTFVCYKTLVLETGTTVSIWNLYHLQKGKENKATKPKISRTQHPINQIKHQEFYLQINHNQGLRCIRWNSCRLHSINNLSTMQRSSFRGQAKGSRQEVKLLNSNRLPFI